MVVLPVNVGTVILSPKSGLDEGDRDLADDVGIFPYKKNHGAQRR